MRKSETTTGVTNLISRFILDVAELPDRTSPDDWPEAMLITGPELEEMLRTFAADVLSQAMALPEVKGCHPALRSIIAVRNEVRG